MIYRSTAELDFELSDLATVDVPGRVLMTSPEHFDVRYVINPHMAGNVGTVVHEVAVDQWNLLRGGYESLGVEVHVVPGAPDLPDMVFCANQTLPYVRSDGTRGVVLSRMHADERRYEVPHYRSFFGAIGYESMEFPGDVPDFEGMGDALWHTGRRLLWGGFGFRSSLGAYEFIAESLDVRVVALCLEDPDFYHLDTCLSIINEQTALIYPGAFDGPGVDLIHHLFDTVIEAPEEESRRLFACNAHSPDGEHVLIQAGCDETVALLKESGLTPIEVPTDEFLKAGGSVFCMKQMFW